MNVHTSVISLKSHSSSVERILKSLQIQDALNELTFPLQRATLHAASRSSLAPSLAAAPAQHWQDTDVPAADAAGCLETASMELAPTVMVMGQGTETQAGKGHSDTITAAVCVIDGSSWDELAL